MKRGLVFTICALALAASGRLANAQVVPGVPGATEIHLSMNLRYTDPHDVSEGGSWYLVAKTGNTDGIAGLSVWVQNVTTTGIVGGNGGVSANGYPSVSNTTLGNIANGGNPYNGTFGTPGITNIVYGQDTAAGSGSSPAGSILLDVGGGAGKPGNVATDPLRNPNWNNASLIASGTFGATRPSFSTTLGSITGGNFLPAGATATPPQNTAVAPSAVLTYVRGDNEVPLFALNADPLAGLRPGDINRDGVTDIGDFSILQVNFNGTPKVWDTGDVNDDNVADIGDFSVIQVNFNQTVPAPVTAVPEPASLVLTAIFGAALVARRRLKLA